MSRKKIIRFVPSYRAYEVCPKLVPLRSVTSQLIEKKLTPCHLNHFNTSKKYNYRVTSEFKPLAAPKRFIWPRKKYPQVCYELLPEGSMTSGGVIVPPEMSLLTVSFPFSVFVILSLIFRYVLIVWSHSRRIICLYSFIWEIYCFVSNE